MKNDENIQKIFDRHIAFWNKNNFDTAISGLMEKVLFPTNDIKLFLEDGELNPFSFSPETYANLYTDFCEKNGFKLNELFRPASPMTAFPWMEGICGCKIYYSKMSNTVWSEPYLDNLNDLGKLKDYKNSPWYEGLIKHTQILKNMLDGRFPMVVTLMRGITDIISALRGPERMIYDMMDTPDKITALAELCTEIYIETWEAQMEIIPKFFDGYCCGSSGLWAPEKAINFQEDATALLSPSLYRELILPFDNQIAGTTPGYSYMHTHSVSTHILSEVLSMKNLKCLQISIDDRSKTKALINEFKMVQKSGKSLMICGDIDDDEYDFLVNNLAPEGLCIYILREEGRS